jgi:AcrR family transcriptional regulator
MKRNSINSASTTEEKIKNAAREVFLKKGYAATRTRDIAETAGENLALINYYFKSKENLHRIIMLETMGAFINTMIPVFNNPDTSLDEKIEQIVSNYTDLFLDRPDIPLFILNQINQNADKFLDHVQVKANIMQSHFFVQLAKKLKNSTYSPMHFFISFMGMIIFPFAASPMIQGLRGSSDAELKAFLKERKELVPAWAKLILKA